MRSHRPASIALCAAFTAPVAVCAVPLPDGELPPEWITLIPAGEIIAARDGRRWTMPDAEAVLAATRARAGTTDLAIDYEHQTEHAKVNGQPAPAAGWIRETEVREGALWGRIEWTARAAAHIEAKEYRYFSPAFAFNKQTARVIALLGGALVNNPALDLPALASVQISTDDEDSTMDVTQLITALCAALGLPENTTAETLITAVKARFSGRTALCEALGVAQDADDETLLAKAKAVNNPGEYVPRAEFDQVSASLATLQADTTEQKATTAVDQAIEAGKITPAQRDWAMAYAKRDLGDFEQYVKDAPVIVAPGARTTPSPGESTDTLTAEEKAVCKTMGVSEDAFLKQKKARIATLADFRRTA